MKVELDEKTQARIELAFGTVRDLQKAVDGLRTQLEQQRALPHGPLAWDRVVKLTAAANAKVTYTLPKDFGRIGVKLHVATAPAGFLLGVNENTGLTVTGDAATRQGDDLDGGRIGVVVLDNTSGGSGAEVWAFLAVGLPSASTMPTVPAIR